MTGFGTGPEGPASGGHGPAPGGAGVPSGAHLPDDRDPGIEHGSLTGATIGMAVGTALSRLTGVIRVVALTTALGGTSFADAYNLANTTPNIVTDIVVGGVLAATFVPVFVDRLSTRRSAEAWRAISAVTTATVLLLIGATVAFWFAAPAIIALYTVANHAPDVRQQQAMAVTLLRWFVPQLTCYGLIALFTALLNARRRFAAPMFVSVANNVVVIVVLLWFHALVPHRGGDDDRHHGAQTLCHPPAEPGDVAEGPSLGQRGCDGAHDRHGHHAEGQLEEGVGVGVRGDGTRGRDPVGQGEDDDQGDLVRHHHAEGPAGQADDGAHRLVTGFEPEPDVEPGPPQ